MAIEYVGVNKRVHGPKLNKSVMESCVEHPCGKCKEPTMFYPPALETTRKAFERDGVALVCSVCNQMAC